MGMSVNCLKYDYFSKSDLKAIVFEYMDGSF